MREHHTNWVDENALARFAVGTVHRFNGEQVRIVALVVDWTQRTTAHDSPFVKVTVTITETAP